MDNVGDLESSGDDLDSSNSSSDDENTFKNKFGLSSLKNLTFMRNQFEKEREDVI